MRLDFKLDAETGLGLALAAYYSGLFINKFRVHGEQIILKSGQVKYRNNIPGSIDIRMVRNALYGTRSFASYGCDSEGNSKWTMFDIDIPKEIRREIEQAFDPELRTKLEEYAWRTIYLIRDSLLNEIKRLGFHPLVFFSGSKGLHIYILFAEPIPAEKAVMLGQIIKHLAQLTQQSGPLYDLVDYQSIESYPCPADIKTVDGEGLPHLVKLPLVKHKETGKFSALLDPADPRIENQLHPKKIQECKPDPVSLVYDILSSYADELKVAEKRVKSVTVSMEPSAPYIIHTTEGPTKLIARCAAMRLLMNKIILKRHLEHIERVFILFTMKAFGAEGTAAIHDIMKGASDYNFDKTQKFIDHAIKNDYKPYTCEKAQTLHICPLNEPCPAVGHYRSPLGVVFGKKSENRAKIQPLLGDFKSSYDSGSIVDIHNDIEKQILTYLRETPEKALLIESDPGSGKTVTVAKTITNLPADLKKYKRIVWAAQRHDMYEEMCLHIPNLKHIRPKVSDEENFPINYDDKIGLCCIEENEQKIRILRDKGWAELETKKVCLFCNVGVKNCEYFQQWNHSGSFYIPQQHLVTNRIQENKIKFDLLVVDENPSSIFEKEIIITCDDIQAMVTFIRDGKYPKSDLMVTLLENLNRALAAHKAIIEGHVVIREWDNAIRLLSGENTHQGELLTPVQRAEAGLFSIIHEIDQSSFWLKWSDFIDRAEPEDMPKNWLYPLFTAVKEQKFVVGVEHNSRICIKKHNQRMALAILNFDKIQNEETPILFLDATAEPDDYKRILDRDIINFRRNIKLQNPVYHLTDGEYPLESIMPDSDRSRRTRYRLLRLVKAIIESGEYTLVVSTMPFHNKYLVDYLKNARLSKKYCTAYYRNLRGTNDYQNCDQIVLIGVANPNMDEIHIREQARRVDEKYLSNKIVKRLERYGDSQMGRETNGYEDERMNKTLKQKREYEMIQAIYRIRPLQNPDKKIWILSAIPLEFPANTNCLDYQEMAELVGLKVKAGVKKSYKDNVAYGKLLKGINKLKHNHKAKFTTKMLADAAQVDQRTVKEYTKQLCKDIPYLNITKNGFVIQNEDPEKH